MARSLLTRCLDHVKRRVPGDHRSARPRTARPRLETLEDRSLPAPVFTWTGSDPNSAAWSHANNWKDQNGSPAVPSLGSNLLFDKTAVRFNSHDDFSGARTFASLIVG